MNPCPSLTDLQRLLTEELPLLERTGLEQHVEQCPDCQKTLERLTHDPVVHPAALPEASAPAPLVKLHGQHAEQQRSRIHSNETTTDALHPAEEPLALDFLGPTSRSDALGRLGHYEILEVLGRGGFGIVLRAFDERLHRVVAIKVMTPAMAATSPARKRFLREARAAAQLRHDNVVQIHAVEEQPLPYLVMEYIPGGTLQQRLDRTGPFEAAEVVAIGRQIADGLAAAHAAGLIHRDIKPANVLIESGPRLRVKITDFGLARAADDASVTQSGVVAGTPLYMSPEQARGETLDARSDLFSLGSVLFAITSGRPPFRAGNTMAVLKRVCEDTPRPIPEIIPETPAWLCRLIARLMDKSCDRRFQTALEVSAALAAGLTAPESVVQSVRPPRRGRLGKRLLAGGVLVLACLVAATAYWLMRNAGRDTGSLGRDGSQSRNEAPPSQPIRMPAPAELAARPAAADALDRGRIPPRLLAQAGAGDAGQAPPSLVAILGGRPFQVDRGLGGGIAFSPDGKRLATADGPLRVWDVMSGQELFSMKNADAPVSVAWSPDGKLLASGRGTEAGIWDLAKRQQIHSLPGHEGKVRTVCFSPRGDRLATGDDAGVLRIWNVQTGERLAAHQLPEFIIADVVFDSTGTRFVTAQIGTAPRIWDTATGQELVQCKVPHPTNHHPCVSIRPDGKRVVTTAIDGKNAYIWNAETGQRELELVGSKARLFPVAYSPDGKLIATGGDIKDGIAVRLWNADSGAEITPLRGPTKVIYRLAFSPDGKWLAGCGDDHRAFVWETATGLEQVPGHQGPVKALALSPDGKVAASAASGADTRIRLWDLATGRLLRLLPARAQPQCTLAFSPDGKTLASGSMHNGEITFWSWQTGKRTGSFLQGFTVTQLAYSSDGKYLAFRLETGETKLFELATTKLRMIDPGGFDGGGCVAFSPDSKTLASGGSDKILHLWDVDSGKERASLPGHQDMIRWAGFRPDGRSIAFCGAGTDRLIRHWGLAPRTEKPSLRGHTSGVLACAWRGDGKLLVSAGREDGTVRLWEPDSNPPRFQTIRLFQPGQGRIQSIALTPEGRHLVTGNTDGTIYVLRLAKVGEVLHVP